MHVNHAPKSQRLGIRLTEEQQAHLDSLRTLTKKSISELVNRAIEILTHEQVRDLIPPNGETPLELSDEVWSQLVLDTLQILRQSIDLHHRLISTRQQQQPIQPRQLYRAVQRCSTHLSHVTKTLASLNDEQEPTNGTHEG